VVESKEKPDLIKCDACEQEYEISGFIDHIKQDHPEFFKSSAKGFSY